MTKKNQRVKERMEFLNNCDRGGILLASEYMLKAIAGFDPIMASAMVRNCVYRGRCPEMKCYGYYKAEAFKEELEEYWSLINR